MIEGKISIRFYPLTGEDANYTGMADVYRDYLINECGMEESNNDKAMSVNLIGGTEITKSFLGVPYNTLYATTTVEQADKIISELSSSVNDLAVKFKGFGANGVDLGGIGNGYVLGGNIGSDSQFEKLISNYSKKVDL